MKSLSCTTLPADPEPSPPPTSDYDRTVELKRDGTDTKPAVPSPWSPKIHTLLEVIRCEFAKPGRASQEEGYYGIRPAQGWTPIHFAAYYNREAALLHFICGPRPIDASAGVVESPLLVAVAAGHLSIVRALCTAGADVNAKTRQEGETALHLAIKSGRADILDVILACNPETNVRTAHRHESPLHYAVARTDSLTFVTALLKHGASVEALDADNRTPAEAAILRSNINAAITIVDTVQEDESKLVKEKRMLAEYAEQRQNRATMSTDQRAKLHEATCPRGSTLLVTAIQQHDTELAAALLKRGSDPNRGTVANVRPIFAALECDGSTAIQFTRLLAEYHVDAKVRDLQGLTVLQATLERASELAMGEIETLFEILLQCGADPGALYADRKTLLHHAVRFPVSNPTLAQGLVTRGVDVDCRDVEGSTALHYASSRDCIEVLLKHGADPLVVNKAGLTPLLSVVTLAETEPDLSSLIKVSDPRAVGPNKKTVLHVAAERGLAGTVRILLLYQGLTTLKDENGRVPLVLAVLAQQWHVVPFLARQPGINTRDLGNRTALHHLASSRPGPTSTWADVADVAVLFCEKGVSRSLRDEKGRTPLILAVIELPEEGVPVVDALLTIYKEREQEGPGRAPITSNVIGHEDCTYRSALYYAVDLAKPAFVLALLKSRAPFSFNDWRDWIKEHRKLPKYKEVIKILAEHEYISHVRRLICLSGQINPETGVTNEFPLGELGELLEIGLDPNALPASKPELRGSLLWTILNQTVSLQARLPLSHLPVALQLLHNFGADMNAVTLNRDYVPIRDREAEQQAPYRHPLTFLLEEKGKHLTVDIVNQLLKYGCDCDIKSPIYQGRHPLHSAVAENRIDIVRVLLTTGRADINPLDEKMQTPLFIACEKGLEDMAAILLKANASVNIRNSEKRTSLHLATAAQNEAIMNRLIKAGATPLDPDDELVYPSAAVDSTGSRRHSRVSFAEPSNVDDELPDLPPPAGHDTSIDDTTRMERDRAKTALSRPRRSPSRRAMGPGMPPRTLSDENLIPPPLNGRPRQMGNGARVPPQGRGPYGPSKLPMPTNSRRVPTHRHGISQMPPGFNPGGRQDLQPHIPQSPYSRNPVYGGQPNSPHIQPNRPVFQAHVTRQQVTTPSPRTRPLDAMADNQRSNGRLDGRQPSPLSQPLTAPQSPVRSPSPIPPASPPPVTFEPTSPMTLASPATEASSPPPTHAPSPTPPEPTNRRKKSRSRTRPHLLKKPSFASTLAAHFPFHRHKTPKPTPTASSVSLDHAGAQPASPTTPSGDKDKHHPLQFLRNAFSTSRIRMRSRTPGPGRGHGSISASGSTATLDSSDVMILNGGGKPRKKDRKSKDKEKSKMAATATATAIPSVPDLPLPFKSEAGTFSTVSMPNPPPPVARVQYQTLDPRASSNGRNATRSRSRSRSRSRERQGGRAGESEFRLTLSSKPRVDSGVGARTQGGQATQTTQGSQANRKPWPTLDPRVQDDEWDRRGRSRTTRTPEELSDWLQIQRLMEGLS